MTSATFSQRRFVAAGAGLSMAVLGLAGVLKFADLDAFRASLESWTLIPAAVRPVVAGVLPAAELTVCTGWLLTRSRRGFAVAGLVLLAVVTVAYAVQAVIAAPPNCDCFGKWLQFRQLRASAWWVVVRNVLLMGMLAASVGPWRGLSIGGPRSPAGVPSVRRGFTLVEMLVVISVVALLIALSATGLAGVKQRAKVTQQLSRFASVQKGFTAYTVDYKDTFPCLVAPGGPPARVEAGGVTLTVRYFEQNATWHLFLASTYFGVAWSSPAMQPNGTTVSRYSGIYWCDPFLTSPEYWNPDQRQGPGQRRGTRTNEVLFPSHKVSLVLSPGWGAQSRPEAIPPARVTVACVDGSAAEGAVEGFSRGLMGGVDAILDGAPAMLWPGMNTINGVRGRDVMP